MQKLTAFLLLATIVVAVCFAVEKTKEHKDGKDKAGHVSDKAHPMRKQMGKPNGQKDGQNGGHMERGNGSEAGKPNRRGCKCGPGRRGRGPKTEEEKMAHAAGEKKGQQEGKMKRSITEAKSQMAQRSQGKDNRQRGATHSGAKGDRKGDKKGHKKCRCRPQGGRGGRRGRGSKGQSGSRRGENKDKKTPIEGY